MLEVVTCAESQGWMHNSKADNKKAANGSLTEFELVNLCRIVLTTDVLFMEAKLSGLCYQKVTPILRNC